MTSTIKPFGAVANDLLQFKFELRGKYYVADKTFNYYEVSENEYLSLKLPIKERG